MPHTQLGNLRRARSRVHMRIDQHERMLQGYRDKLASLEAEIHAIAPELALQPARRRSNPVFARGELTRFALDVLREEGAALPIRVIAVRVLAIKGHLLPEPRLRRTVRHRLRQMFVALDKRGVTVKVGDGNEAARAIASNTVNE